MKLYLRNQKDHKKGIDEEGLITFLNEVESLQLLFKDHFREAHKNLSLLEDYVGIEKAIEGAKRLLFYFIPETYENNISKKKTSVKVHFSKEEKGDQLVHYASFYRIFGNLIKNISDHGGHNVSVSFEVRGHFFHIVVENDFHKNESKSSSDNSIEKSFCLRSIERNCLEHNGEFKFTKKEASWKSEICLPFKKVQKETTEDEKREGA